jgi:hypothetical protein
VHLNLRDVPGVPESALSDAEAARLPETSAPAPWDTVLDAVVWWHRAVAGARRFVDVEAGLVVPVTTGALIRYHATPVGPYREVLASPVVVGGLAATVPFIAVDSAASVHGGRANWRLPKAFAEFNWPAEARGRGWSVTARVRARPRRFGVKARLETHQPGLRFTSRVAGRARIGSVEIETEGETLPRWLLAGRHPALILERATVTVAAAQAR